MKAYWITVFFLINYSITNAQVDAVIDSLEKKLALSQPDTNRVSIFSNLATQYLQTDANKALSYATEGFILAKQLNFKTGQADCIRRSGLAYYYLGRYPEALNRFQKALEIGEDIRYSFGIASGLGHIGNMYLELGDFLQARNYFFRSLDIAVKNRLGSEIPLDYKRIGETYLQADVYDSATLFLQKAYTLLESVKNTPWLAGVLKDLGDLQLKKGSMDSAMLYYKKGVVKAVSDNYNNNLSDLYLGISELFFKRNEIDSSIVYGKDALDFSEKNNYVKGKLMANKLLAEEYEKVNVEEALKYHKMALLLSDSLFSKAKISQVQNLFFQDQERKNEIEKARTRYNDQLRSYALFTASFIFLVIAGFLYRNNRLKQKAKSKIEKAYHELRSTQAQLIQAEKMASLGELTAGIAHEIQNPLNFVNNFSEVNKEMITEMKEEIDKGNYDEVKLIAKDIEENSEKINHHGKRADAIVKGMLQHSRTSSGQKELTDINALCDEYLRLAYHGLRAKDKSFNAKFETDFDLSISKINVVPQDIGRVLLNLINNAFYAVNEKAKLQSASYEPLVTVSTKKLVDKVEISVKDNGNGIPQNIVDKIFQPFFTTKPTGQGTGLGLSLAYDIVKAHGGEIKVETKEGEGSEFAILLPLN